MRTLGMISGTSHDGIDAAVVDFELVGDVLHGTVVSASSTSYAPELRRRLIAALPPAATSFAEVCELDTLIGQAFAAVAAETIARVGAVDLVCSHGQTVYHWVSNGVALGTLQIGEPAWIAEAAAAPVVSGVRIRDVVRGGQGAPLVSLLDALLLGSVAGGAAALNLGGISNMTVVGEGLPVAWDIGPANALIDAAVVATRVTELGYDADGAVAASGTVDETLLGILLDEPFYALSAPRSTGKELFHWPYVEAAIERAGRRPDAPDLVATLTELTVRTVAAEVRRVGVSTLVVSGGGVRNPVMMAGLIRELPGVDLVPSDEFGAPSDAKEAIAFALIGWMTAHGLPSTLPSATGASAPSVLGSITPGPNGFGTLATVTAPRALQLVVAS
ncbi:MAG: anhydro-N-acetylmuramic acid kinase [Actinomycetota bacterium]|nr:anhydro-N-acetylmuramic acid kinase [Actinomycetota bacterium]